MKALSSEKLTIPDLVLLSLLAERPMHGYQVNALLEFRKVRDWAGVSRPQVYYSLDKLARLGLLSALQLFFDSAGENIDVAHRAVDVGRDPETVVFFVSDARGHDVVLAESAS
jgi:Fe2+ or Zn2+ uptake regulation protein